MSDKPQEIDSTQNELRQRRQTEKDKPNEEEIKKEVIPENPKKDEAIGVTSSGERFQVPETYDVVETLSTIKKWKEIPVFFNLIIIIFYFTLYLIKLPSWVRLSFFNTVKS